jgi:hypothetical protein
MLLKIRELRQRCAPTPRTAGRSSFAMQVPSAQERGAKPIFGPAPSRDELTMKGAKFVTLPRALFDEMYTLCEAQRQGAGGQDVREQFAMLMQTVSLQAGRGELGRVQDG